MAHPKHDLEIHEPKIRKLQSNKSKKTWRFFSSQAASLVSLSAA
jgi:hypothetical protein